jgi:hypothetical protein
MKGAADGRPFFVGEQGEMTRKIPHQGGNYAAFFRGRKALSHGMAGYLTYTKQRHN